MICFHLISKFVLPLLSLNSLAGKPRVRFCTLRSSQVLQSKKKQIYSDHGKKMKPRRVRAPKQGIKLEESYCENATKPATSFFP